MPLLDQGPHLPGETAKKETDVGKRDEEERRREGGGVKDEGMGNRMFEGCEGRSSVKCDCLCKQRALFLHAKPKTVLQSTRCSSTLLVCLCACLAFHSWNKNEIWAGFTQCHDAYFTLEERKLGYANQTHHNLTLPLLHHTLYVHHHHVLMVIIVQLFKLSTPPLFSAHLFACICARPASLTFFLLPNISCFSKLLHLPASSPLAQSFPPP